MPTTKADPETTAEAVDTVATLSAKVWRWLGGSGRPSDAEVYALFAELADACAQLTGESLSDALDWADKEQRAAARERAALHSTCGPSL